jgi:hypothetical protein
MRADALAKILEKMQHQQHKRLGNCSQHFATHLKSQRWSGESSTDAVAFKRRQHELDTVVPP